RSDTRRVARPSSGQYVERYGMTKADVEPALLEAMKSHPWPGNVRELENTVATPLALTPDERLSLSLSLSLTQPRQAGASTTVGGDPGPNFPLRTRVETFEREIIAEQFAAAK